VWDAGCWMLNTPYQIPKNKKIPRINPERPTTPDFPWRAWKRSGEYSYRPEDGVLLYLLTETEDGGVAYGGGGMRAASWLVSRTGLTTLDLWGGCF